MKQQVTIEYYGMEGTGPTMKEARADASRKLESFVKDARRGAYMVVQGEFAKLLYRDKHGWQAVWVAGHPIKTGIACSGSGRESFEEALYSAAMDIAHSAWSHAADDTEVIAAACQNVPQREQGRLAGELLSYFGWQRKYKQARDAGHDDNAAREIAGGMRAL